MQIHVARPPTQFGVFSPEEVAEGLRTGRFLPTDHGWREGMAAWSPLSQWTEFAGVVSGSPAAPAEPSGAAPLPAASQLPWEMARSLRSAWDSFVSMLVRPAEVLSTARLEFGSSLQLAWVFMAMVSVFTVFGGIVYANQIAAVMVKSGAEILKAAGQVPGPMGELLRALGNYLLSTKPKGIVEVFLQTSALVLFAPFFQLITGFLQWLALRLLGVFGVRSCKPLAFGRTAIASMLATSLGSVVFIATSLLPPGLFQSFLSYVLMVPFLVIYARAVGGALRVNPWLVVGSAVLAYFLFACCCGCSVAALFAGAMSRA